MLQVYQQPHAPKGEKEETHHGNGKTNYNLKPACYKSTNSPMLRKVKKRRRIMEMEKLITI
jgi:hypothetical protein